MACYSFIGTSELSGVSANNALAVCPARTEGPPIDHSSVSWDVYRRHLSTHRHSGIAESSTVKCVGVVEELNSRHKMLTSRLIKKKQGETHSYIDIHCRWCMTASFETQFQYTLQHSWWWNPGSLPIHHSLASSGHQPQNICVCGPMH